MRVLIINKFLYPNGGSETYIFKLGEKLCQKANSAIVKDVLDFCGNACIL